MVVAGESEIERFLVRREERPTQRVQRNQLVRLTPRRTRLARGNLLQRLPDEPGHVETEVRGQQILQRIGDVRERVDLDGLVAAVDLDAAAARIDIDAVLARIDLVGIAEDVIDQLDLPEIIRDSTGSMASDTLREVRMQGISGDEAVTRAIDRLRLRRSRRPTPDAVAGPSPDGLPRQPDPLTPRES